MGLEALVFDIPSPFVWKKNYFFLFQPWPKNLKKPFPALAHVAALSSVVAVAFERWRTFLRRQRRRGERGDGVAGDGDDGDGDDGDGDDGDGDDVALFLAFQVELLKC